MIRRVCDFFWSLPDMPLLDAFLTTTAIFATAYMLPILIVYLALWATGGV